MSNLIQSIKDFFASMAGWGINLPTVVLVPLVIVLSIVGVVVLVKVIQWLIKLIFRDKGKKFVNGFTEFTKNVDEFTKDLAGGK